MRGRISPKAYAGLTEPQALATDARTYAGVTDRPMPKLSTASLGCGDRTNIPTIRRTHGSPTTRRNPAPPYAGVTDCLKAKLPKQPCTNAPTASDKP